MLLGEKHEFYVAQLLREQSGQLLGNRRLLGRIGLGQLCSAIYESELATLTCLGQVDKRAGYAKRPTKSVRSTA